MANSCLLYQPSFASSPSDIPFLTNVDRAQMADRKRTTHGILKTASADNSPNRIAKRDMMFNHCRGGQRRAVKHNMRDDPFHSTLLRPLRGERLISSLSSYQLLHIVHRNPRPSHTWQDGVYQTNEVPISPTYLDNNGFYPQQHNLNLIDDQSLSDVAYPHYTLDTSNRNSITVMESLSSDPPTTNYLISSAGYEMPLADGTYSSSTSQTALLTPNVLPIQQFKNEPNTPLLIPDSDEHGEELVGVGLYDEPEGVPPWDNSDPSCLGLGRDGDSPVSLQRAGGKGLKLEETFDPSTMKDSQDDDDDDDGGHDDDESQQEGEKEDNQGSEQCNGYREINHGESEIQTPEDFKTRVVFPMQGSHSPFAIPYPQVNLNEPWVLSSQPCDPEASPVYQLDMAGRSFFFEHEQDPDFSMVKVTQPMNYPTNMLRRPYGGSEYGWV
ncbi:hypothetical protein PAAG_02546 [Paracoccidioides lutzii Pb01]|uniref:Uncharacterized protein n=1 Tax=Paracoccidioides lutzii (strain ATCC MYA-826 / Pb01) TaxID=502779 RepID=C1GV73_PARBA|nr:hypothetical protein PAAG_02546 [Paracoccidioides lutzii Pb01]EEH40491.2 hypothetical protein PAAG_02546 [Paracoccidioides lutzii Pb01]